MSVSNVMTPASTEKVDFSKKGKEKNKNRIKKQPNRKESPERKKLDLSQCLLFYFICAVVLILLFFLILVFFFLFAPILCFDFILFFL